MKWFKHESSMIQGAAVRRLILRQGLEAYGLYVACVELISQNLSSENPSVTLDYDAELLADWLHLKPERANVILDECVSLGLFNQSDDGTLSCPMILKSLDTSLSKSMEMKKLIQKTKSEMVGECRTMSEDVGDGRTMSEDVGDGRTMSDQIRTEENRKEEMIIEENATNHTDETGKPESIPFDEILEYLNSRTDGRFKARDETRQIITKRWREGYRTDDFKQVVDNMRGNEFFIKKGLLRPQTLFSTKMDGYLKRQPEPDRESESKSKRQQAIFRNLMSFTPEQIRITLKDRPGLMDELTDGMRAKVIARLSP